MRGDTKQGPHRNCTPPDIHLLQLMKLHGQETEGTGLEMVKSDTGLVGEKNRNLFKTPTLLICFQPRNREMMTTIKLIIWRDEP